MADEVPAQFTRQQPHLGFGFLHAAFAEKGLARFGKFPDRFGRMGLGNGHERHLCGAASGPVRGGGDLVAHGA